MFCASMRCAGALVAMPRVWSGACGLGLARTSPLAHEIQPALAHGLEWTISALLCSL